MQVTLKIPEYDPKTGLDYHWQGRFEIKVESLHAQIVIHANKAGLESLAIQLLTLAQDNVPVGCHFHYDDRNSLQEGSNELVICKLKS